MSVLKVLRCIHPGEPVSADLVMQRAGVSRVNAGSSLFRLWKRGNLVRLEHGVYTLNTKAAPIDPSARRLPDLIVPESLGKWVRGSNAENKKALTAATANQTVRSAIRNQHPLQAAWGAPL